MINKRSTVRTQIDLREVYEGISRPNPVWAENNADGHRSIIISCNLNEEWLKIRIGYGNNKLVNGKFQYIDDKSPNGTYELKWHKHLNIPRELYSIASKIPTYPSSVNQDIDYYGGRIFAACSVTPSTLLSFYPEDDEFDCKLIHTSYSLDNDSIPLGCANEGVFCYDGKVYIGVSSIRGYPFTEYCNKILKFDL